MTFRSFSLAKLIALSAFLPAAAAGQGVPPEIAELRARVTAIRASLPQISGVAEQSARFLGFPSTGRFLIPGRQDRPFYHEFFDRAGGPPDTRDTDAPDAAGLVLLPVRHWDGVGLGVASASERWQAMQRPVVLIGPANGRPSITLSGSFLDDGAPNGDRVHAPINGIANMIVGWTFYAEVAAAATRAGWQPGVLQSVLVPGAVTQNAASRFRTPTRAPPPTIAAGQLGAAYLTAVDSMLDFAATPAHQAAVEAAADRLRALRAAGHRIFVASCGHYLMEEIAPDTTDSPFIPIDFRKDMLTEMSRRLAAPHDVMVWFGYQDYDCPNATVAMTFFDRHLDVILISASPPVPAPAEVVAEIPLSWRFPDAVVTIPFAPARMAPLSSVEMTLHYLWLRRLVAVPRK